MFPRPSLTISLLYQFLPTYTDKFCYFIFFADSSAYGENRQNGGLTRFRVGGSLEDIFPQRLKPLLILRQLRHGLSRALPRNCRTGVLR